MSKPKKKLRAEPVYMINGLPTDKPFHDEMLASQAGQDASDKAAVQFATRHGWSLDDAVEQFVSSPSLKAKLRTLDKIPAPAEEIGHESVDHFLAEKMVSPGVKISDYTHRIPKTSQTAGNSWMTREHKNKGKFKLEATVPAPQEGRTTYVLSTSHAQGGTTAYVDQYSRAQGAENNHVVVYETDYDHYGCIWRKRTREFIHPNAAFKHIANRYGVKLS